MTISDILAVLRRWWSLIVAVSVVTTLVLAVQLKPTYTSRVMIQITQPPSEQVLLFEQSAPYSNLRDELVVARNNLVEAVRSSEVRGQTIDALGLSDASRDYLVDVAEVRDSDFLVLSVEAPTATAARAIADAHATLSIQQTARLRALPVLATKQLLIAQVAAARAAVDTQPGGPVSADPATSSPQTPVSQARTDYQFWQKKLSEAEVKSDSTYAASFMQVVSPAELPLQPSNQKVRTQLVMGALGSLIVSFAVAILLDALSYRLNFARALTPTSRERSGVARL
ncbi:MAG: hypothetical protein M3069_19775 [Chloroflexota bacterium]|nr:hypothetical protein [Chloroflexota bacterium]